MRKYIHILLIATLLQAGIKCFSQNVASPYQVGTWSGFRSSAISYTFDDGCSNQFTKAIPIFDEYGYKLTLNTVTDWSPNWTNLKKYVANGHEVANHSKTHADFSKLTVAKQKEEVTISNDIINTNIPGQKCITMAYPYCATGKDSLHKTLFIAARGCSGQIEPKTPGNFMNISSVICGSQGSIIKVKDFKNKADQAAASKGWLVYLLHGVDNDGGYSPVGSDTLRASLEYLSSNDEKFWVNTFANVARYIKERNNVSVSESSASDKSISVEVTDTLDNEIFDFPVTIRRPLPEGWNKVEATQNGDSISVKIVEVGTDSFIQFEAVPDAGTVVLSKIENTGVKDSKTNGSLNNEFNIWYGNNKLNFTVPESCQGVPSLLLFDMKGSKLQTFSDVYISNRTGSVDFCLSSYKSGVYLFCLKDNRSTWLKKFNLIQ